MIQGQTFQPVDYVYWFHFSCETWVQKGKNWSIETISSSARVVVSSPAAKPASSDTSDVIGVEEHLQVISASEDAHKNTCSLACKPATAKQWKCRSKI